MTHLLRNIRTESTFLVTALLIVLALYDPSLADNDINWSMRSSRNKTSPATNVPSNLETNNVRWKLKTGTHQYSIPVIDKNRLYLGVNDSSLRGDEKYTSTRGGMLLCVNRLSGEIIWKQVIPRFIPKGNPNEYHFNRFQCGICSSPVFDSKRIYLVASDGSVLCLDKNGLKDGNDGPYTSEYNLVRKSLNQGKTLDKTDGDIIWRYDLLKELDIFPHDVCGSTILYHKGNLYICTSNGVDFQHKKISNPDAPSLIVLNAETGRLLATADEIISKGTFHGQWSSPAHGRINGKDLIFLGGGDGKCYAFEALKKQSDKIQSLKQAWSTDCNPPEYRFNQDDTKTDYSSWRKRTTTGPSEVIGTAVLYNERVYVAIGQSPYHGPGAGMLSCLDAETGRVIWKSDLVDRTTATVAIQDGLLYVSDFSQQFHCIDADTGKRYWVHDLDSDVWCASPVVADEKVFIGTSRKQLWIFKTGKTKTLIQKAKLPAMPITVVPDNGCLYVPTQNALTVYESSADK